MRAGTFAPERRASLKPMAIACFRLLTFACPPDFSSPRLYSRITLPTFFCALAPYFRPELLDDERELLDFLPAVDRAPTREDFLPVLVLRLRLEELRLAAPLLLVPLRERLVPPRRLELDFFAAGIRFWPPRK